MDPVTCDECDTTGGRELLSGWREVARIDSGAERLHFCSLLCEEIWCGRRREENSQGPPASATTAAEATKRSQELARHLWRVPPRIGDYPADDAYHGQPISRPIETVRQTCPRISPHVPDDMTLWQPEGRDASNWRRNEAGAESEDLVGSDIGRESITIERSRTELWPPKETA